MYATLETYEQHDFHCPKYHTRENYEGDQPSPHRQARRVFIDTPELRRKRRGGMGIDSLKPNIRENFTPQPNLLRKPQRPSCKPYDAALPYRYMFDPHYNKYPYGPDYKVVDGEDDGKRFLNVPAYSYPDFDSTTRVMYCDAPPKIWELCDDSY